MIYNIVNIIISRQVVRNRFVAMVHFTTMLVIWKEPGSWKMNYNRTKLFNSSKVQLELSWYTVTGCCCPVSIPVRYN